MVAMTGQAMAKPSPKACRVSLAIRCFDQQTASEAPIPWFKSTTTMHKVGQQITGQFHKLFGAQSPSFTP